MKPYAVSIAEMYRERFTPDFPAYVAENLHVYEAFETEAFKAKKRGFKHYSARTIVESLRHHSALTEASGPWKLNNSVIPDLSRLFALLNPQYADLFEYRESRARVAA